MRIGVLTTGRQDWGILRSTCHALQAEPSFALTLIVGGMHCSEHFGRTERLIAADGFSGYQRLDWMGERVPAAHEQAARALESVGRLLRQQPVDSLMLVGDRFETAAAAIAASLSRVPIVHLHGGEETEGSIDNALRHAITKLSHLHLTSHVEYARRVCALGEDPKSVHVVGAPGLDNLQRTDLATRSELEQYLELALDPPVVLVTLHPTTLGNDPATEASAVAAVMDRVPATYVVTLPNTDPGHEVVRDCLRNAARAPRRVAVEALGERRYFGLLRLCDAILGNSSSALIEAPALELPAVNVGDRQKGRVRGANVIDTTVDVDAIEDALRRTLAPQFRASLRGAASPFGLDAVAPRIIAILHKWQPPDPPIKPVMTTQ